MKLLDTFDSSSASDLVISQPFFDSFPNGLIVLDRELRIVLVNHWVTQALGLGLEELRGREMSAVFPELAKRNLMEAYRLVMQTHMPLTLSNRIHRYFIKLAPAASYQKTFLEMPQTAIISPLVEGEELVGTLTMIQDVTERVMTERALQTEINKLNVLHTVSQALATLDLRQCLQVIVQSCFEVFRAEIAALYLYRGSELRLAYQIPEDKLLAPNLELFESISRSQKSAASQTALPGDSRQGQVLAELAAPLIVEGECTGILSVRGFLQYGFSADERKLLDILASRAAIAIHNARLHNREKTQRELLESLKDISLKLTSELEPAAVLDSLFEGMKKVLPYDSARVVLTDNNYLNVVGQRGYEHFRDSGFWDSRNLSIDDFPYLAEMAASRYPKVIPDTLQDPNWRAIEALAHVRSTAGAPIFARGVLTGFVLVEKVNPGFYTDDYLDVLVSFSDQAGIALENARLYEQQKRLAQIDGLTGVANRRGLDMAIAAQLQQGLSTGYPTSLLMLDIDLFKHYNDTNGHLFGDCVIKNLAALLQASVRPADLVGRYGGEEFVVLLPDTPLSFAQIAAERLRQKVERMHKDWPPLPDTELPAQPVTISIGVASAPQFANTPKGLVMAADAAMYAAKQAGRNRVVVYHEGLAGQP